MTLSDRARQFKFIKELTNHNDGLWVELVLSYVGCKKGDPWCAALVSFVLGIHTSAKPPFRTASCEAIHQWGKANHRIVKIPQEGDIVLLLIGPNKKGIPEDHAHHTGIVTGPAQDGHVPTIEGNTNPAGGRDGYGVFERERAMGPHLIFVRPL